jgi:triacylglycerol lipase
MPLSRRQLLSTLFASLATGATAQYVSNNVAYAQTLQPYQPDLAASLQFSSSMRQNTYPIIMVHGFAGFTTLLTFSYWGGINNIAQDLAGNGYTAYPIHIGPYSSNWDRACELYAQIKGGTVDYGAAHAKKFGHARYGRTFPGVVSQWGNTDPQTGKINKIHLLGHSMGGQTMRQLASLLANGSAEELTATSPDQLSSLFAGNKASWLDGILGISATHNGSTAIYFQQTALPFAQPLITYLAAAQSDQLLAGYDFMLDQWGLVKQSGESLSAYINRVENSPFSNTTDSAFWDLNPSGSAQFNGLVKALPNIYYFSLSTLQTFENPLTQHQLPDITMNPLFDSFSLFIGQYTQSSPIAVDSSWWPNDGLVSTNKMSGPIVNSTDTIMPYNGTPLPGVWNNLGTMNGYGHIDIIGWGLQDVRPLYRNLASTLASLPQ